MNETLSFCKHDVPVKLGCKQCISEAIKDNNFCVESFAFAIRTRVDELFDRMKELEKWQEHTIKRMLTIESFIGQNYERDINRINDKITDGIDHIQDGIEKCFERIEKLENKIDEIVDFDNSIKESLTQLNNRITAIVKDYNSLNLRRIEENTLISRRLTDIECFHESSNEFNVKTKHKISYQCPKCSGRGFLFGMNKKCDMCDSSGNIWG